MPGFGGRNYKVGPQSSAMPGVPGITPYMQSGMHMNPMLQQQMLMNPSMRFPVQSMHLGPPNTPPPPYTSHPANVLSAVTPHPASAINTVNNQQRVSLSKSKENRPQSEKERMFEEQRRKLKQFGKPGASKVDEGKLIGSIFAGEAKPKPSAASGTTLPASDDDGFGDFLQGPSTMAVTNDKKVEEKVTHQPVEMMAPGPELTHQEEKKDLKSIMLEYSDLSAPKKAKGFHKPTLNEVQKTGHDHHKSKVSNFHESDHARRWTGQSEDLNGLFQLPVQVKPAPFPVSSPPHATPLTYSNAQASSFPAMNPPSCPPPSYTEVAGQPPSPVIQSFPGMVSGLRVIGGAGPQYVPVVRSPSETMSLSLPDWCTFSEDLMPPVYKQVWEASLVDNKIITERLYPILLLSGLPREKLAEIWSLCNTATPGQLVKHELWLMLALIALTQHNYNTNTLDNLVRCPVAPVPQFTYHAETNTPATLLTTPVHHQVPHPAPLPQSLQPAVATHSVVAPSASASSSASQSRVPQTHLVQYPKPQPPSKNTASLASGLHPSLSGTTPDEDDFSDFQAAVPSLSAETKDEGFGEFIGGGGGNTGLNLPSAPVSSSGHLGNGFVGTRCNGFSTAQPQQHQQQPQQQTSKPTTLSLASLPVDDKYGTNIRSFFCSSDSSTGKKLHLALNSILRRIIYVFIKHLGQTSPSFDDDDFTDGRDSLSQVSTSEQSENEDLRNFETYVEEFHQKKELPDGSPLHCPFPAVQQNQASKGIQPAHASVNSFPAVPLHGPISNIKGPKTVNLHINPAVGLNVSPLNSALVSSAGTITSPPKSAFSPVHEDDFADFKSASLTDPAPVSVDGGGSLIGDEDKYGALRVFSIENNFSQPSVFEKEDLEIKKPTVDDDEWADFSAAVPAAEIALPEPVALERAHSSNQRDSSNKREDILKLYNSTPASKNTVSSFNFGSTSSVNSEDDSKNGSMFGDDHSTTSTPSKSRGLDSHSAADQLSSSSISEHDVTVAGSVLVAEDSGSAGNWANFDHSLTLCHSADELSFAASPNDSKVNRLSSSGSAINMISTVKSDVSISGFSDFSKLKGEWESGSRSVSTTSSSTSLASMGAQNWRHDAPTSLVPVPARDGEDEWSHSSSANIPPASKAEESLTTGESRFVTIKKQNLGTNEIMGLFKVRDDPATLSSYQLPPQMTASKMATKKHAPKTKVLHSPSDDDTGPPPLEFGHDDDEDDHAYSRGYDFDDAIHRGPPTTVYTPFGMTQTGHIYGTANLGKKSKDNREDSGSVHSLELPSTRPVDASSSDNVSLSSADYNSSEAAGVCSTGGAVSAESKSLDSLDLRNDPGDPENGYRSKEVDVNNLNLLTLLLVFFGLFCIFYVCSWIGFNGDLKLINQLIDWPDVPSQAHHHPIQPQELLDTMPDFADKYNIEHEAQGSDRYGHEWERCLCNCYRVILEANTLFNTISSSSVCNEVLKSSQGSEYVSSVIEIYRVVCRIMTSMRSTAISTTELEQKLKDIDLAWNNLAAFLVGASLLPDQPSLVFTSSVLKSDTDKAKQMACGICLLSVDVAVPSGSNGGVNTWASLLRRVAPGICCP
ncbi:hypothetical protein Btru_017005 [Bulinus truncatus]|nr:hypothetical protein Btru_017005 [Bulinus truncatus]